LAHRRDGATFKKKKPPKGRERSVGSKMTGGVTHSRDAGIVRTNGPQYLERRRKEGWIEKKEVRNLSSQRVTRSALNPDEPFLSYRRGGRTRGQEGHKPKKKGKEGDELQDGGDKEEGVTFNWVTLEGNQRVDGRGSSQQKCGC